MKIYTLDDILKTEHLGDEKYVRVEEIEQLRKALERYGGHDSNCTARVPQVYQVRCSCGYEQALKER